VFSGEALWMRRSQLDCGVDLSNKLRTKAWPLPVVSERCKVEFGACGAPKDDL